MTRHLLERNVRRTTMISALCIGVLLGIAAVQFDVFITGLALLVMASITVCVGLWKRYALLLPFVVISGIVIGSIQASAFALALMPYESIRNQNITIEGTVSEDATYSKGGDRQLFITEVTVIEGGTQKELPGELFVSTPMSADVLRHDRVRVEGKLRDSFGGFQGSIFYAQITKVGERQHAVDDWRARFAAAVSSSLPEPHASLGLGFVIGMKSALPPAMEDALRNLSLTHVVVASGYNLTILVRAAKRLREKHSKLQTLLLSFGLVTLFLFVTGNSPSMVRAALVSGLVLGAWYFGRQFKPHALLLLVMAATALYNPTYLWGDLGWWLSFAAFAGIMIIAPLIIERIWQERKPSFVSQIAIEAMVAQAMTTPIIMLVFGDVALLGIIANVLIVPLVPFAMLGVAVAGFAGLIIPALAPYVAIPAVAILEIIISIVESLNLVPGATRSMFIGWPLLLFWYGLTAAFAFALWHRLSRTRRERALMRQIV